MIQKKHILAGLVILLVAGLMTSAFFLLFEEVEREQFISASLAARKNPFLAAERFLTQMGFSVESIAKREILINPPPTGDLIFVSRLGGNLPTEREDNLIAWIEQGGTLMITHAYPWDYDIGKSGNNLLDRLGVRRLSAHEEGYDDEESEDVDGENPSGDDEQDGIPPDDEDEDGDIQTFFDKYGYYGRETLTLTDEDGAETKVQFIADRVLEDVYEDTQTAYAGESGNHVIIKAIGQGKLIVLSDNYFMRNGDIGENDHAYFLTRLVEGHGKIWLLYNSVMPSFLSLVFTKAPAFMASLAILSIMSLLWLTIRIGPQYRVRDHSRRNIIEHLSSAGFFIMKRGTTQDLLQVSRAAVEKKILAKHLFFHRKTKEEQMEYIAKWTRLSKEEVQAALTNPSMSKDRFISMSSVMQKITQDVLVNTHTMEKK